MPGKRQIFLIAGPSGSGKSRLSALTRVPQLRLDDFYHSDGHPNMPRTLGIIDWDHPDSWDAESAVKALKEIVETGSADIPRYEISENRATGTYRFDIGDGANLICEGIFATELLTGCSAAGLDVTAIWLDRPAINNFGRRLQRDLREHRKPPTVLVRRGIALLLKEPELRRDALARGFKPMGLRAAQDLIVGRSR